MYCGDWCTSNLTYAMRESICDLMEPIRFGEDLARRVLQEEDTPKIRSLVTCTKAHYRELCLNMEQLTLDLRKKRDLWKVRFFFHATNTAIHVKNRCVRPLMKAGMERLL